MADEVCLVIDGNNMAHRAYHAFQNSGLTDSLGNPTWTVHGFYKLVSTSIDKIVHRFGRLDHLILAFDDPLGGGHRRAIFPEYKANRAVKDPAVVSQIDECLLLSAALGLPVVILAGLEADDVLATVSRQYPLEFERGRVVLVTNDRDALGCVSDSVSVLKAGAGTSVEKWFTPESLYSEYGVAAGSVDAQPEGTSLDVQGISRYTALAALRGDPSDNIDGVKGIGPAKAAALLENFGSVEAALEQPEELARVVGKAAAKNLAASYDVYVRNVKLMRPMFSDFELSFSKLSDVPVEYVRDALLTRGLSQSGRQLYNSINSAL